MVEGTFAASSDAMSVVKAVEARIKAIPNVKILPMTGEAAIAGLEDQILGTGPGEVRDGVKTGAVDSSWVRDAVAAASGDASKLLFVTGNSKDVRATAKAAGFGPVNIRTEHSIYSSLFGASAAPAMLSQLIASHLQSLVYDPALDPDPHPFPVESMLPIHDIDLGLGVLDNVYPIEWTEARLAPGSTIVGMLAVDVVDSPDPSAEGQSPGGTGAAVDTPISSTVEFQLIVLTDLQVAGYEIDQDGQVQMQSADAYSTVVVAPVVADVEDHYVEVTANGTAVAESAEQRFSDGHDALTWLLGELAQLSGVTLADDDTSLEEFALTGSADVSISGTLSGDVYDEWTLSFELAGTTASVSCVFDAGARVWAGKDSFDSRPPYFLTSDSAGVLSSGEPYSAIGEIWRHLNQL